MFNRVHKATGQANNFVLDLTDSKLADDTIEEQIKKIFTDRQTKNVRTVIAIKSKNIIKVYKK